MFNHMLALCLGVDFSGDPNIGDGSEFVDVLRKAKQHGLKLALHMAEIRGLEDENSKLLSLPPDRIGHGTFLHESELCESMAIKNRSVIPEVSRKFVVAVLEMCGNHLVFRHGGYFYSVK